MDNPRMRFYSHQKELGSVLVTQESTTRLMLFFNLSSQSIQDKKTAMFMARHPAFPSVVGFGATRDDAAACLNRMFKTYTAFLLSRNGVEAFESHLVRLSFVRSKEEPDTQDDLSEWGEKFVVAHSATTI